MKKILALIVSFVIVGALNVSALTEEGLKEKVLGTIEVNGEKYTLPSDKRKIAEDYFEKNEISDKDATYIGEMIDKAIEIAKKQKSVKFTEYPETVRDELQEMVEDISKNTDVKASLTKDGLTVKNTDGSDVVVTELVKQTGYETSKTAIIVAISFIIVAVGTGLVIKQVKTSE